jgi:hypothetical protein
MNHGSLRRLLPRGFAVITSLSNTLFSTLLTLALCLQDSRTVGSGLIKVSQVKPWREHRNVAGRVSIALSATRRLNELLQASSMHHSQNDDIFLDTRIPV